MFDEQITERQAIVKVNQTSLTEIDFNLFHANIRDGMYRIKTDLWGHEFLFISDMNLPVDPDVEEPVLELKKNMQDIQQMELVIDTISN